ncbi:MAG: cytochrome P450 [Saprospirales bacterium]|nr:cytochrome P450 [Saprospirales bacterium]
MLTTKILICPPEYPKYFSGQPVAVRKERIHFFVEQQKKLGDIFQIKVPTRRVVVVSNPEWIKYVLVDNNKNYGKSFAYDSIKLFLGNGLLTSEGEFWKRQRRLAQPAFHKKNST